MGDFLLKGQKKGSAVLTEKINNKKVCLIGGDLRQIYASEVFSKSGYSLSFYALDTYRSGDGEEGLKDADIILLPIPLTRGDYLNFPLSDIKMTEKELALLLLKRLEKDKSPRIFGGMIGKEFRKIMEDGGFSVTDLCENERFNTLNAVPTAEGAISIAMANTKQCIDGSNGTVLGYGRIGKCLSRRLSALGCHVTVVARSERDLALASSEGYKAIDYKELPDVISSADVIYNTVPVTVLLEDSILNINNDTPVIELASKPGGIDMSSALRHGIRVIAAPSLPGKFAPKSAGKIIAEVILSCVRREERQ